MLPRNGLLKSGFNRLSTTEHESMSQQVLHPMVKLQRHVRSLVESGVLKPTDGVWKIAFLYQDKWDFWKQELEAFEFSMKDPVSELLSVQQWDED